MRIVALLVLSLTLSCTTDVRGLAGGGGAGGTATAAGRGGGTSVGGATGTAGAAGMAGSGGAVGTGGAGTAGAGGTGGAGGGTGGAGCCPVPPSDNGQSCALDADCKSGHCVDQTCCSTACVGVCRSCANSTGTCTPAAAMSDPRGDCPADPQNACGSVGACDGSGACALAAAGAICKSTPTCDATNASVIARSLCNGAGACVPDPPVSCNGFACVAGACQTTCSDDSACASAGFCSAQTCIVSPNLAGNGDLETGTLTGWSSLGGFGSLLLSSPAASGYAHNGQFSAELSGRTQDYQGPVYALPSGLGEYSISAWAMQTQDNTPPSLLAQIWLACPTSNSYINLQMTATGLPAPPGTWLRFAADVDTKAYAGLGLDCLLAVKSASLLIDQLQGGFPMPNAFANIYVDDLVVRSTDGHNLIGNSTFEAGLTNGWSTTGGASMLAVSSLFAHGGQYSLSQGGRAVPASAVTYPLPIGAARYAVSLWVLQSGTTAHPLALLPLYSCIGSSAVTFAPPSAAVTAPPGVWTQLTGTFSFPPADAPQGCVLSRASVAMGQSETGTCGSTVECPDLFVDDASITLK